MKTFLFLVLLPVLTFSFDKTGISSSSVLVNSNYGSASSNQFLFNPVDSCGFDPYEPNNTPQTAFSLEFDTIVSAQICTLDDYDYFSFEAEQGDYIRVYEIFPFPLRPVIYILNQNLSPVFNNLYTSDMQFFANNSGKHYIVVTKRYYHTEPFDYSFGFEKLEINPDVISVTDVPNDQGLQVEVIWKPSYFDPQQGTNQTDFYALWREANDTTSPGRIISGSFETFEEINYLQIQTGNNLYRVGESLLNFIAQIPAVTNRPFNNYSYIAPTLYDKVPTTFIVSAIPKSGFYLPVLWGAPGTGISIDNITPEFSDYRIQPTENGISLTWEIDRVVHYDIDGFNIYRQSTAGLIPNSENLIASIDSEFNDYIDAEVMPGQDYFYVIEVFDNSGNSSHTTELTTSVTSVELIANAVPAEFHLQQNYPNPFNPGTVIGYQLPVTGAVTLKVYDVLGNEIATLVDEYREQGIYEVTFDAGNLPSGIYIYRLQAGSYVQSRKMALIQ